MLRDSSNFDLFKISDDPFVQACTNGSSDILNKSKLLESLNKTMPVNCKDATFKILGISLAAINTILSILIVIFSIRTLVYEKN